MFVREAEVSKDVAIAAAIAAASNESWWRDLSRRRVRAQESSPARIPGDLA